MNGDFTDRDGKVANKGFAYYTEPSLWDDYRNKLVLLGLLSPKVTEDVIKSLIDKGEKTGFMPTFFHGDHAAAFIAGSYLRGLRDYDVNSAYNLLMRNATVEGGTRPYISEYMAKGYVPEEDVADPKIETKATAGVTKTLEYAYDDYSVALLANELGKKDDYEMLMKRAGNFKNVFDSETGLMRGKLANGEWIKNFDPEYPYYEYMYREANAWQSSFFAPQDVEGLIALYPSKDAFEKKLDDLFSIPWKGVEAANITVFIGQYCHGNQPDHNFLVSLLLGRQAGKSQAILDHIMDKFYDMGKEKLAYAGMDDAGEMSAWYVFNAIGLYTFSPADPEYIVTVPIFDEVKIQLGDKTTTIRKEGEGRKIDEITYGGKKLHGYFISDADLKKARGVGESGQNERECREQETGPGSPVESLLVPQRLDGIEASGEPCGNEGGEGADDEGAHANEHNVRWHDFCRDEAELVDLTGKNFDVEDVGEELGNLVAVLNEEHTGSESSDGADEANHDALREEHTDDLRRARAEGLHHADVAGLLHRDGDERIHDAEGGDDDYEEQQEEENIPFHAHGIEELLVQIDPRECHRGRFEFAVECVTKARRQVAIWSF